jgi:hypothetical protein
VNKNYDEEAFLSYITQAPFQVRQVFDDPDDMYWAYTTIPKDIIEIHDP